MTVLKFPGADHELLRLRKAEQAAWESFERLSRTPACAPEVLQHAWHLWLEAQTALTRYRIEKKLP
jgi:hypothetical protein